MYLNVKGQNDMTRKLRVGVIGCDPDLRAALPFIALPTDRAEIVAIADHDPEMIEKSKKVYPDMQKNAVYYDNASALIADPNVEAVFIMVRDHYHEEMAVEALEAGKAVYLEKPMAITLEGCDRILETAYRTKSKLFVGHNMRYMQFVLKMKEIIDSGVIGEIQSVWVRHFVSYGSCYFHHWCAEQKNCTGLLLQKGAHDIDVIHWLAGASAKRVVAMGRLSVYNQATDTLKPGEKPDRKVAFTPQCWPPTELPGLNPAMDVEDHNIIMMELANGIQATYMHCMYTPDSERNYTFIGTRGRIENIGDMDYENGVELHVWTQRGSRKKPDIVYHLHPMAGGHGGADVGIVPAFVDFVLYGKKPDVSPVDARNAVAAGYLGHQSMRNGNIPFDVPGIPADWQEYFDNGQQ